MEVSWSLLCFAFDSLYVDAVMVYQIKTFAANPKTHRMEGEIQKPQLALTAIPESWHMHATGEPTYTR